MFALAKTMYLCRTLGELLRMHSGCFCYRSNNVWFWKEQGLVSFAEMKCQKCKHFGAHNTPLPYIYISTSITKHISADPADGKGERVREDIAISQGQETMRARVDGLEGRQANGRFEV